MGSPYPIPTLDDWHSEPWCLDTETAFGNFFGKTFEEAVHLFEKCSLAYQEDVMAMPDRVFGFYLRAYMAYLQTSASASDSDGASCFISGIEHQLGFRPDVVAPLWPEIRSVLEHLAANQSFYQASPEIYGSFAERCEAVLTSFSQ